VLRDIGSVLTQTRAGAKSRRVLRTRGAAGWSLRCTINGLVSTTSSSSAKDDLYRVRTRGEVRGEVLQ